MTREIKFRAWDKLEKRMFWNVQNAYDTLDDHFPPEKATVVPVTTPETPIKLEVHSPVKAAPVSSFPFSQEDVNQISPMLASKGETLTVLRISADPKWVAELKLDGGRYMLYILKNGARLFSRHISVKDDRLVEKTENVPHITHVSHPDLAGTVLDGEITIPGGDFGNVLNVMGAHSDKAEARQAAGTQARLTVFDCPRHKGRDITNKPLHERQAIAKEVIRLLHNPNVVFIEQRTTDKMEWFKEIVAAGGEGIILKDINSQYYPGKRGAAWIKVKKHRTYDVIISGFYATESDTWAKQGLIGSVIFSVYNDKGILIEVGRSSGMTLAVRRDMSTNPALYKGQVCEIEGQEVLRDGIRHPRFIRMRPDANVKECTQDKLMRS